MSSPDLQAVLSGLLSRVPGARGAVVLSPQGIPLAQAGREATLAALPFAARCARLLQASLAAAQRLGRGPVTELLLETDAATLAMIPLKDARSLCLLMEPEAAAGRGLFEARKAAAALDRIR